MMLRPRVTKLAWNARIATETVSLARKEALTSDALGNMKRNNLGICAERGWSSKTPRTTSKVLNDGHCRCFVGTPSEPSHDILCTGRVHSALDSDSSPRMFYPGMYRLDTSHHDGQRAHDVRGTCDRPAFDWFSSALAPVPGNSEGGGGSPLALDSFVPGEEGEGDDDSVGESEPLLGREDWGYERHRKRSTPRMYGAAMVSSDAGGSKGNKKGEAKVMRCLVMRCDTMSCDAMRCMVVLRESGVVWETCRSVPRQTDAGR